MGLFDPAQFFGVGQLGEGLALGCVRFGQPERGDQLLRAVETPALDPDAGEQKHGGGEGDRPGEAEDLQEGGDHGSSFLNLAASTPRLSPDRMSAIQSVFGERRSSPIVRA